MSPLATPHDIRPNIGDPIHNNGRDLSDFERNNYLNIPPEALIGARVRSYDFTREDPYWVEGRILDIQDERYVIQVEAWIVNGRPAKNFTVMVAPHVSTAVIEVLKDE